MDDDVIFIVFLISDLRCSNAEEEKADVDVKVLDVVAVATKAMDFIVLDVVAVATKAMDLIRRRRDHMFRRRLLAEE